MPGKSLDQLTLRELQSVEKKFAADALKTFDLQQALARRNIPRRARRCRCEGAIGKLAQAAKACDDDLTGWCGAAFRWRNEPGRVPDNMGLVEPGLRRE